MVEEQKGIRDSALFDPMAPLLDVQNLRVSYAAQTGQCLTALAKVSFALQPGETLGVLGESGSGKSTLAAALLRLLPAKGRIEQGAVHFEGRNLLRATPRELEKIRGDRLALIFQEPSLALHPAIRVAEQIGDVIAAHKSFGRRTVRAVTDCGRRTNCFSRSGNATGNSCAFSGSTSEVQSLGHLDHAQSAIVGGIRGSRAGLVCRPSC